MEANQSVKPVEPLESPAIADSLQKKYRKYYMDVFSMFIHKTQSEKRRELFGKDPLVNNG